MELEDSSWLEQCNDLSLRWPEKVFHDDFIRHLDSEEKSDYRVSQEKVPTLRQLILIA